ncbi:MAG: hypothetical protein FWF08_08650, partial [Oscillospiraceae bacterium]|nr:hypothetical protein [Oscillospiraceae bacterium]
LHKGIVKVVKEAYANRKDGSIYYGKKETPEIQRDSRLPHVFCNELYRLRFVPADGSREVWLLNYSSHTESMLGRPIVSADFACYMRRGIEEMAGADSIYFVSSVGGLIRLKELDKDPVESTVMGGKALAETAVAIEDERKLEPVVNMLRQEYYSDADNFLLMTICQLGLVKNENRYATGSGTLGIALKTEMTYFEIGDLKLLLLPGELFPELAIGGYLPAEESAEGKGPEINPEPLCEIAGNRELMIFGLANDFTGYVVPPNDYFLHSETPFIEQGRDRFDRGHYEETNSLGPNTAHAIANTFKGIMKTVGETKSKR